MARLKKAQFDLFDNNDMISYNELLNNPCVIIESRSMMFIYQEGEDDEENSSILKLSIKYSEYDQPISNENYFKKARLFTDFGLNTRSRTDLDKFLDNSDNLVEHETICSTESMIYHLVEYVDRTYSTRGKQNTLSSMASKYVEYCPELGEFIPIKDN